MTTADWYRQFAETEARGWSPCYEQWARGVADDAEVLALLDELPYLKRQPNLLFTAARYAGVPAGPFPEFRDAVLTNWSAIRNVLLTRRVQTNEPGRCAVLLPLLAALPQPLALLEVGASAGLCLYPDRYSYRYGDHPTIGTGPLMDCEITGPVPLPKTLPRVVWRAGIDLNPLDVRVPDDVRWLETLIWPEHEHRRTRLAGAIEVAKAEPARIVSGDLNEKLEEFAGSAPDDATLVVFHTAVLVYLDDEARARFTATMRDLDARWIANEIPGTVPVTDPPPSPHPDRLMTLLALDGEPMAYAAGHGQSLHWITK